MSACRRLMASRGYAPSEYPINWQLKLLSRFNDPLCNLYSVTSKNVHIDPKNTGSWKTGIIYFTILFCIFLMHSCHLSIIENPWDYWPISYLCYQRYYYSSYLSIYTALVKHNHSVTMVYGSTYVRTSKKLANYRWHL